MTNSWLKEHLLCSTMIVGLVAGLAVATPSPVWAQDADDDDDAPAVVADDDDEADERITVTGSRLRRDEFTSASPLQVIDGQVSRELGLLETAEILQTINVTQGQQIDSTFGGFVLDNGPGASTVGLRGLDPQRTLVMINGRRLAPAGVEGAPVAPDLNLVPSSIVERIEILLDGASSVYGSDAIAGVVNIILRQDFDGFQIEYARDFSNLDGGESQQIAANWGISNDRGYIGFAGEYFRRTQLAVGDVPNGECNYNREITTDGEIRELEIDTPGWTISPCKTASVGGRVFEPQFTGSMYFTPGRTNMGVPDFSRHVDADGDGLIDVDLKDPFYNAWDDNIDSDLISPLQRWNFYTYGEYDLRVLGDSKAFFEASYANRESTVISGAPQLFPGAPGLNPFNTCGSGDARDINGVMVVQNPNGFNCLDRFGVDFGALPISTVIRIPDDRNRTETEVAQVRVVAGLRGELPFMDTETFFGTMRDWSYELSGSYTRSNGLSTRRGIREDRLALSLGTSVRLADGSVVCGIDFDADGLPDSVGDFDLLGFLDDGVGCVPVDVFGADAMNNIISDEARDYLFGMRRVSTIIEQTVVNGYMTGALAELQGGPLGVVVGFEFRDDEIVTDPNDVAADGLLAGFFADLGANGRRSLHEWFFEAEAPLMKDGWLGKELTVRGAARWTEEQNWGAAWTYSLNGIYRPVEWLMFRGTYGTSFRAPNLREAFFDGSTGFQSGLNDPCVVPTTANNGGVYDPAGDDRDPTVIANCQLDGVDPFSLGLFGVPSIQVLTGGTEDLDEETSTAWTAGFVFDQPWFEDFALRFSMTYSDIDVRDTVNEPSLGFILNDCYNSPNLSSDFCGRVTRDTGTGLISLVDAGFINIGQITSKTLDYNLFFGTDLMMFDQGFNISIDARATNQTEQFVQVIDTSDDNVGEAGTPDWRASVNLLAQTSTDIGTLRFQWFTRYISEMDNQNPDGFGAADTCLGAGAGDVDCRDIHFLEAYWVHNTSLTWELDTWAATAGITNVFEEWPTRPDSSEILVSRHGNLPLGIGYDLTGRSFFLNVAKRF